MKIFVFLLLFSLSWSIQSLSQTKSQNNNSWYTQIILDYQRQQKRKSFSKKKTVYHTSSNDINKRKSKSLSRFITSPYYEARDCEEINITTIEIRDTYTIVCGQYRASDEGWAYFNAATFLRDRNNGEVYSILKIEGLPFSPNRKIMKKGDIVVFRLFFRPLPKDVKCVDLFDDPYKDGAFNFYNIDVTGRRHLITPPKANRIYDVVDQMPEFPGGQSGLMTYLSSCVKYPAVAEENGIQGRVTVQFVVERDGSIADVKTMKSVDPSLDSEAERVIRSMPKWSPGILNGRPVRVKYFVPVVFRLS